MNRPVYFYGAMSLDGYLATEADQLEWLLDSDLGGTETFSQFEPCFDTLIMGRTTYQWTRNALGPTPLYPGKHKYVLSHHPQAPVPAETTFIAEPVEQLVTRLQALPGGGIWIVGGGQIVADLLAANLISELWVQIAPVLLGRGKPLFPAGDYAQRLSVIDRTQIGELTELHLRRRATT